MSRCLDCLNLDLQRNPKHAGVGFGWCKHKPSYCFTSICAPICEQFRQAPEEIMEKRIAFEKSLTTKEK
jgi:hypothetical protein